MSDDPLFEPYRAVAERVIAMATGEGVALDAPVPACPGWSARDVVHHLVGLCQDWVSGNLDEYASDEWTTDQVERFQGKSIDEVAADWRVALDDFGELTESPLGATPANWAFGDAVVHEADLRPVLAPGTRVPADAVGLGLRAAIARWRGELTGADAPPLRIVAPDVREWWFGDESPDAASVSAEGYEWFRALFGRRSLAQVEAFDWSADPRPWLAAGLPFPFTWADADLVD